MLNLQAAESWGSWFGRQTQWGKETGKRMSQSLPELTGTKKIALGGLVALASLYLLYSRYYSQPEKPQFKFTQMTRNPQTGQLVSRTFDSMWQHPSLMIGGREPGESLRITEISEMPIIPNNLNHNQIALWAMQQMQKFPDYGKKPMLKTFTSPFLSSPTQTANAVTDAQNIKNMYININIQTGPNNFTRNYYFFNSIQNNYQQTSKEDYDEARNAYQISLELPAIEDVEKAEEAGDIVEYQGPGTMGMTIEEVD